MCQEKGEVSNVVYRGKKGFIFSK